MELLDSTKERTALSFQREAQNIEFNQIIGEMDANCHTNSKKRDEILANLGKRLFKKHPLVKSRNTIFSIRIIKRTRILSQKEIDSLLLSVKSNIFRLFFMEFNYRIIGKIRDILEWRISIWYKNKSYVIGFRKNRKNKLSTIFNSGHNMEEIFSKEELDFLLKPIDK